MSRFKRLFRGDSHKSKKKEVVMKGRSKSSKLDYMLDVLGERSTKSGLLKALMPLVSAGVFVATGVPPGTLETLFGAAMGVWSAYDIARKEPESFGPENIIADYDELLGK